MKKKIFALCAVFSFLLTPLQAKTKKFYFEQLESFPSAYRYKIYLKDGRRLKLKAGELSKELKGLRLKSGEYFSLEEIKKIRGRSLKPVGRSTGRGAIWGTLGGAVLLGLPVALQTEELCDFSAKCQTTLTLTFAAMGAGLGAGIGALIGAFIPRYEKIQILPSYSIRAGKSQGKLVLSMDF